MNACQHRALAQAHTLRPRSFARHLEFSLSDENVMQRLGLKALPVAGRLSNDEVRSALIIIRRASSTSFRAKGIDKCAPLGGI